MYVINKRYILEKGIATQYKDQWIAPIQMQNHKGFLRFETFLNEDHMEFDQFQLLAAFESKDAFIAWQQSEAHRSMHQDPNYKPHTPHIGVLKQEVTRYEQLNGVYKK
jgi:heme-degrading monooxygenase HmoA